jgi:hypothetical protein
MGNPSSETSVRRTFRWLYCSRRSRVPENSTGPCFSLKVPRVPESNGMAGSSKATSPAVALGAQKGTPLRSSTYTTTPLPGTSSAICCAISRARGTTSLEDSKAIASSVKEVAKTGT